MTTTDYGVTVTLKYGTSHDSPWAVFKMPDEYALRNAVCAHFGFDQGDVAALTNHELVLNARQVATGSMTAADMLTAVAIPPPPQSTPREGGNPWAGLDDEPAAHPHQAVIDAFRTATTVQELQKVWATNQDAFSDETVVAAYKARGKELS